VVVICEQCGARFEDEYRTTICPHGTFAANDGRNNFSHHPESTLEIVVPDSSGTKPNVSSPTPLHPPEGMSAREKLIREGLALYSGEVLLTNLEYLIGVIDTIRADRDRLRRLFAALFVADSELLQSAHAVKPRSEETAEESADT
jgi:hypothetical protein